MVLGAVVRLRVMVNSIHVGLNFNGFSLLLFDVFPDVLVQPLEVAELHQVALDL